MDRDILERLEEAAIKVELVTAGLGSDNLHRLAANEIRKLRFEIRTLANKVNYLEVKSLIEKDVLEDEI